MSANEHPDVFEYVDYRAYLRDYYAHGKRTRRGFSYRSWSRRLGLGSPAQLKRVMAGDRNLTPSMARRCADALGLAGDAIEYFVELVNVGQAATSVERSAAYQKLQRFKAARGMRKLDIAHAAYHSTWYIPAVRELAAREDFQADPKWIARRLVPPIKASEAKAALETLLQMGLLERDEEGHVAQSAPLLTTGPEMHAAHIADYHRAMMTHAMASIDDVPSTQRDISSVTMLVGEGGVTRIKEVVQRFRRELLELAVSERHPTQVIQTNIQIFPLSVRAEDEPEK